MTTNTSVGPELAAAVRANLRVALAESEQLVKRLQTEGRRLAKLTERIDSIEAGVKDA